jgi:1-phosphofructokinase family hexose kinase
MLLCITPNPALDRTLVIAGVRLGAIHRTDHVMLAAGGKGLNVARAAHTLGQPLHACAPLGGLTGQHVAHLAEHEGLTGAWNWRAAGETRTCTLVVDPEQDDATVFNEAGEPVTAEDWQRFHQTACAAAASAHLVTISGSLPTGVDPAVLAALIGDLQTHGTRVIVDTSGAPLSAALQAQPYGIKVNAHELGTALHQPVTTIDQAIQALHRVRAQQIALAVVSLGADGAIAASAAGICHARPPRQQIISSVGSGDSLLAGLATGLLRDAPLDQALALGVACGTADALTIGGGLIDPQEVARLRAATTVSWLTPPAAR